MARFEVLSVNELTVEKLQMKEGPKVMATTTPQTISDKDSGRTIVIPDMAANSAFNLPAEKAGLKYKIVYGGAAADAHDHTITSGADANFFIGSILFHDTDDSSITRVASDGNSNSILTLSNLAGGELFLECDGTSWYINGYIVSDTAPAFSDQA